MTQVLRRHLGTKEAELLFLETQKVKKRIDEMAAFCEENPQLAEQAGITFACAQLRAVQSSGCIERLKSGAGAAMKEGGSLTVERPDVEAMARAGALLSFAANRAEAHANEIERVDAVKPVLRVGDVISTINGALALAKEVF